MALYLQNKIMYIVCSPCTKLWSYNTKHDSGTLANFLAKLSFFFEILSKLFGRLPLSWSLTSCLVLFEFVLRANYLALYQSHFLVIHLKIERFSEHNSR